MKHCKVIVEQYGKIEHAEIEPTQLMLFVGDNNSGKSYLLSLLWALQNFGINTMISDTFLMHNKYGIKLCDIIIEKIKNCIEKGNAKILIKDYISDLQHLLNESLEQEKNNIIAKIFNSNSVSIGKLQIILRDIEALEYEIEYVPEISAIGILEGGEHKYSSFLSLENEIYSDNWNEEKLDGERYRAESLSLIKVIFSYILDIYFRGFRITNSNIYLPAARTGFMLTKNIINQVGRNIAFNSDVNTEQVTPFIRPINHFLDVINSLSVESEGDEIYKDIISFIETEMAFGKIEISDLPSKEVVYVPEGKNRNIPLRVVSAVVSELSPLILILKHFGRVKSFYYEEPEMCLHPQLQNSIARIICRLVNCGTNMIVTTHSDIIIQYINNMIALSNRKDREKISERLGYTEEDILDSDMVRVYQLKSCNNTTKVENVACGKNGFAVDSFNDALDKIMNEAYMIQE